MTRLGGSRIRRGRMAADRFTQISNALFRDTRISLKAKGLFGLLSTHRDGYGVTAALIARQCKEGVSAIEAALRELETFGYLERERERRPDGTLGAVEYFITDAPAEEEIEQNRRSEPNRDYPGLENPVLDNPPPKNTSRKNTNRENTTVPPSPAQLQKPRERTRPEGRTGNTPPQPDNAPPPGPGSPSLHPGGDGQAPAERGPTAPDSPPPVRRTPGMDLLSRIGAQHPGHLLTGRTLMDQGAVVDRMLAAGWTRAQVREVVAGRPLPQPITTSPGAVIAHRLREAEKTGPPMAGDTTVLPASPGPDHAEPPTPPTPTPPRFGEHHTVVRRECEGLDGGCGRPVRPGYDRCTPCLDLPACECGEGRYDPARGETRCPPCQAAASLITGS